MRSATGLKTDITVGKQIRVEAEDLYGIPKELVPYFDLDGTGVIHQHEVYDVCDFFDRIPPGNANGTIDGPDLESLKNFVRTNQDVRQINLHSANRLANRLRNKVLTWCVDTKVDYLRLSSVRERAERRYHDFAKNRSNSGEFLVLSGNLVWAAGLAVLVNVAAILVPFGVLAISKEMRSRERVKRQDLQKELAEFYSLSTSSKLSVVDKLRDEMLEKIDAVAADPNQLRELEEMLEKKLKRPRVPLEDDIYRSTLLYHARKNGLSLEGSSDNLEQKGLFYTSKNWWNPFKVNGRDVAKELNKLDETTFREVHVGPKSTSVNTPPTAENVPVVAT